MARGRLCECGSALRLVLWSSAISRARPLRKEHDVVGETPNLAARLQALAEPGTIIIDASTRRLLADLFEYHDLGAIEVKGFAAPVQAHQVIRQSAVESRFEALHAMRTPLVGREEDIDL